jgi:hypothetical protein
MTPGGIRDGWIFFLRWGACFCSADAEAIAEADASAAAPESGWTGGGALSRVEVTDVGSASSAWRNPRSIKSRCC